MLFRKRNNANDSDFYIWSYAILLKHIYSRLWQDVSLQMREAERAVPTRQTMIAASLKHLGERVGLHTFSPYRHAKYMTCASLAFVFCRCS